jgi:hypothetical protein
LVHLAHLANVGIRHRRLIVIKVILVGLEKRLPCFKHYRIFDRSCSNRQHLPAASVAQTQFISNLLLVQRIIAHYIIQVLVNPHIFGLIVFETGRYIGI